MTTSDYIPFVNSTTDASIASRLYSDAMAMRVSLELIKRANPTLPSGPKKWIDAGIDGLHHGDLSKLEARFKDYIEKFPGYERIADPQFHAKPIKDEAEQFVRNVLDSCNTYGPDWISIPQLPVVTDSARNKINRMLAEKSKLWKDTSSYRGKLILPAIFTHQDQLNKKTSRNKKIESILHCFEISGADGLWAVDSSLNDQEGSGKFHVRFPELRKFHEELAIALPERAISICGPYWGMNLVLWSRGVARFPAIGLGSAYQYYIPGRMLREGNVRVALPPLRRWAIASRDLRTWLTNTVATLSQSDPARADFVAIERDFQKLTSKEYGKTQIATFYKTWFDKFSSLPQAGRALALYQDLSSSYVLGRTLKNLPDEEGTSRRPERVAQQLMMNCL